MAVRVLEVVFDIYSFIGFKSFLLVITCFLIVIYDWRATVLPRNSGGFAFISDPFLVCCTLILRSDYAIRQIFFHIHAYEVF